MMKNKVLVLSCCLALLLCLGAVSLAGAAEKEPVVGQVVATVKFKAPLTKMGLNIWDWPRPTPLH